ncbi:MAG TPA: tetratricopeptide repeat protein, partial [Tepidisphaeraceae bacterium]|nr:tetratricopeptide repeat protein [Tepidisphaeraceae bacterium]
DFARDAAPRQWYEPLVPEDLPALSHPKYFNDLDKAKADAFAGRYRLALQTLRSIKDGDATTIALIKGESLAATGHLDEALAALAALASDDPRVQLARVRVLEQLGRTADAAALLHQHLKDHPNSLAGHFELGRLCESIGDFGTAKTAYEWFVAPGQDYLEKWRGQHEKLFEKAEDATTLGRALDRWATLTGAYQHDSALHNTILDLFVKSYDVIDRGYWPAHLAAAEYFLAHDDEDNAKKELRVALRANPYSADALRLAGRIAIENYDFDNADHVVDALRRENPNSIQADLLQARNLLRQRLPKTAGEIARKVLQRQPKQLEAMGLVAACEALQLHDDATKQLLADVDAVAPHLPSAYFDVAEQLAAMRQYPRSAAMYQVALDRAPWWTAARNGLGLLYTQSGDEDLARSTLDAAHQLDPYNLSTTNYLRLLDELAAFDKKESAHFIVMYDGKLDPMIPEYFTDYLESIYPLVTREYHTEPPVKTYIEVFPTHDAFSVRTTGSPWIGTVGASTGRVIAMVSPRKGENTQGAFNWSQVLRHEFTHTVTLAATDNRISHWMTEGLAVMEEHSPLQWAWVPMLYHAVSHHELFDMDALTWAFIRPRKPSDRQMAYAESFWVCTYIEQTYGHDAILKMLAEFKAGGSQEDVFPKILGRSQTEFFSEFSQWTQRQIAGWGYDEQSQKKYDELRDQAEELIKTREYPEALKLWEQIAKLRPVDQLPHQRLAGLYLSKAVNEPQKAVDHLKILHQVDLKDDRYAKRIARLYRDMNKLDDARHWAMQAIYIDPYDMDAHDLMAELCEKADDAAGLAREQRVIPLLKQWMQNAKKTSAVPNEAQ